MCESINFRFKTNKLQQDSVSKFLKMLLESATRCWTLWSNPGYQSELILLIIINLFLEFNTNYTWLVVYSRY